MTKNYNKRLIGAKAEQLVKRYLECEGIRILNMNYRCRQGEIDVIAMDDGYLVFVEVKYRHDLKYGYPQEAVDYKKQRRICNAAKYYLYSHGYAVDTPVRFDVASIVKDKISYLKNAFAFYC